MRIYKIEKQISKYIEGYVKSVSDFENADKKSFERKYKYSTLKYFHYIFYCYNLHSKISLVSEKP